ncbi:FmdB family zinc ribbon protein [Tessaracoccus antarcticus]|uniref:FmdB family transcriptional regulator n=1 Tax=Tessaracoccus antarcticus TaxID=2479848 RepID=A0A3M0GCE1_9ACTN|nr:FmdB family zinc ribbon protein [Tessaracoccus antarcticus]RMB62137.1 FmdB family transcriptional regulator [Tessaracoccus antarcticus]
MPTYQYRCTSCGEELEAVQKFTDPALTTCPTCAGDLRKVFSAVGVVFKGSGFYATDSRKAASSSKAASERKSASTAASSSASESSSSSGSSSSSESSKPSSTPSTAA